jgi:cytochrome b subunit of formate dehydrogenase
MRRSSNTFLIVFGFLLVLSGVVLYATMPERFGSVAMMCIALGSLCNAAGLARQFYEKRSGREE